MYKCLEYSPISGVVSAPKTRDRQA